ncbi:MAG TPA: 1-acyl-sn-glycerol-3-phosphate acyltransferase [Sandaracinaceae bacterium LLY-WYZ-13_1]|nr:1-acyl-sn-glycerol-3-phosphate acyltransferase [Sandaracinaceae bacterium LLY-WYZ-13_1]
MAAPITLQDFEALDPVPRRWALGAMAAVLGAGLNLPGRRVRFEVEGWERVPAAPVLFVANHTHWLDWIALRWVAWRRGRHHTNWVKPRTYGDGFAALLNRTGNVPLASRGYLLAADAREVHGRPPDEREYRALRDHLDAGTALPDEPFFEALRTRPRSLLGLAFDPTRESYRACVERLFHAMMERALAHTATLCARGLDVQIMPQGVTAMRLTQGQQGAVQAALALDLTVVPMGINGFPQAFGKDGMLPAPPGGTVTVRVGAPFDVEPIAGLRPFWPPDERAHADELRARTDDVMARIAPLLDPAHRPTGGADELDVTGVARFL